MTEGSDKRTSKTVRDRFGHPFVASSPARAGGGGGLEGTSAADRGGAAPPVWPPGQKDTPWSQGQDVRRGGGGQMRGEVPCFEEHMQGNSHRNTPLPSRSHVTHRPAWKTNN